MLDKMYEENLNDAIFDIKELEFPDILKSCRELMGLKQYACSDYLGMENPRYKKLELGRFAEPIEGWEIKRLEEFFMLPSGMLKKKQKDFLNKHYSDRREICQKVWCRDEPTRGVRAQRTEPNYKRVRGELDT